MRLPPLAVLCLILLGAAPSVGAASPSHAPTNRTAAAKSIQHRALAAHLGPVDHSGRAQEGRASYYGPHIGPRKMASGSRFNPNSNAAASKTLPFGTVAKVTNLANGRSALVRIEDRGPLAAGRVVDVTPKVADQLGIRQRGVAPVVVAPIAVPQADGHVKLGAGAAEAEPREIATAMQQATTLR